MEDRRRTEPAPSLGVYAAAAAFLSAIPVPLVDGILSDAARGAAFRRVAATHGLRLGEGARRALVGGSTPEKKNRRTLVRAARSMVQRVFIPARLATRLEMASRTLVEARLLDLYLETVPRREGAPLGAREAAKVRASMDEALREGLSGVTGALTTRIVEARGALTGGASRAEAAHDDRALLERLVDTLLDLAADLPHEALEPIKARFTEAMAREERV